MVRGGGADGVHSVSTVGHDGLDLLASRDRIRSSPLRTRPGTDSAPADAVSESKSGHKGRPVHDLRARGRTLRRGTKRASRPGELLERVPQVFEPPARRQQGTVGRKVDPGCAEAEEQLLLHLLRRAPEERRDGAEDFCCATAMWATVHRSSYAFTNARNCPSRSTPGSLAQDDAALRISPRNDAPSRRASVWESGGAFSPAVPPEPLSPTTSRSRRSDWRRRSNSRSIRNGSGVRGAPNPLRLRNGGSVRRHANPEPSLPRRGAFALE